MRRIIEVAGRIVQIILIILLLVALLCNFYLLGMKIRQDNQMPTVLGYSWAVVLSGSMEPAVSVDDLIVCKEKNVYQVGDIIMYKNDQSFTTHRIVKATEDGFITKGDANNIEDALPVNQTQIVGVVIFIIPKLGRIMGFIRSPLGLTCIILVVFLMIEGSYMFEKKMQIKY